VEDDQQTPIERITLAQLKIQAEAVKCISAS
jgi:hypothetical protein